MIAVLLVAIPVGICIGIVGIGGVLLPPALTWLAGLDVHAAAGTSSWCFLFTGIAGTVAYARDQAMPWRFGGWLTLGAAPAAAVGAVVNGEVPATALWLVLATLTTGSGAFNLWVRPRGTSAARVGEVPAADFGRPGSGLGSPPSAPSAESGPPSRASAAEPAPPSPQPGPTPPADPEPPQASEAGPGLLTAEPGLPPSALSAEPEPSAAPSAESGPPGRAPSAEPSPPRRASVAEPGSPSPAPLPPAPVAEPSPPRRASAAEPGSPSPAPSAAPEPSAAESAWPGQAPPPPSPHDPGRRQGLPPAAAVAVGVFVGFGSALTGTGGPVLLVPVLLALGVPALTTVAAGQLVQLPLVGFATLGYAAHGSVHFGLGSLLGVLSAAGVLAGARWARKLPGRHLHRVASGALVGFGGVLFALPFL